MMNKPLVAVENLVVRPSFPRHFGTRTWVSLFTYDERLTALRAPARAALLTLINEGTPRDGILRAHRSCLRALYRGRNRIADALRELKEAGVIWRAGEWISINPELAYSGPARGYDRALEEWRKLIGEEEEEQ